MADFEAIIKKHLNEDGVIPSSAIENIVTAIKNTVGNEYVSKERYKTKLNEIDTLKEQQQTAEDNATTAEKWKTKYDALKNEFEDYKNDISEKNKKASKTEAYKALLKEAGVSEKRIGSVVKVADIGAIELDDEGKVKDADKILESIRDEWSDFIETESKKGAKTENPPKNNGGTAMTKEQILAIKDTSERQRAMAENHELFGIE